MALNKDRKHWFFRGKQAILILCLSLATDAGFYLQFHRHFANITKNIVFV